MVGCSCVAMGFASAPLQSECRLTVWVLRGEIVPSLVVARFASLLHESGTKPSDGVHLSLFVTLVNDMSDDGCYCTDDEQLGLSAAVRSRPSVRLALVSSLPCVSVSFVGP